MKIRFYIKVSLLVFAVFIQQKISAQGILDTLAPVQVDTQMQFEQPTYNGYSKKAYLKDSVKLKNLHDSIAVKWTFDDSLPSKRGQSILFPKKKNRELKRNHTKPILFTVLFFLIISLYVLKSAIYKEKLKQEFRAVLRGIFYREWLQEQQNVLPFYVIYSKTLSLFMVGLFMSYLTFRLNVELISPAWLTYWIVFLAPLILVVLKYIAGAVLSYLFSNSEMFKHHFTNNQLIDNFLFIPLLLSFMLVYFLIGVWKVEFFALVGMGIIVATRVVSILFFSFQTLFNRQYKKLYVIFYLCSLEIVPLFILVRWIAKNYT